MVGAASMAFPLFGGFVSKSLIISAASEQGYVWTWAILMFAAAGVFLNAGLKVPYFAFFSCDRGIRCGRRLKNMLVAMAIASAFCIGIGLYPPALYSLVPYAMDYEPYTGAHVVTQLAVGFYGLGVRDLGSAQALSDRAICGDHRYRDVIL